MQASSAVHRLQRRRKTWLQVHLWLGLALGLWLSVIGLTGSVLTFYREIDEWLNPGLLTVPADPRGRQAWQPLAAILDAAAAAAGPRDQRYGVRAPRVEGACWAVSMTRPSADGELIVNIYVDPYRARVTGERAYPAGDGLPGGFIDFIAVLHYRMLLGWEFGGLFVGIVGLIGLFSLATGLIVWWPLTGRWKQALSFKRPASIQRRVFDLHKCTWLVLLPVLLAVLLSGAYFNLSTQFRALVEALSPGTRNVWDDVAPSPGTAQVRIGLVRAFEIARAHSGGGTLRYLMDATEPGTSYGFIWRDVPGLSAFYSERTVRIDAHTGKVLATFDPSTRKTAGDHFIEWQWPLHSGQAFGMSGRLLVLASGLGLPLLFMTGVLRWRHKRSAKRKAQGEFSCNSRRLPHRL